MTTLSRPAPKSSPARGTTRVLFDATKARRSAESFGSGLVDPLAGLPTCVSPTSGRTLYFVDVTGRGGAWVTDPVEYRAVCERGLEQLTAQPQAAQTAGVMNAGASTAGATTDAVPAPQVTVVVEVGQRARQAVTPPTAGKPSRRCDASTLDAVDAAFAPLQACYTPRHSAADAAWNLGYALGLEFVPAAPLATYSPAEREAWHDGYEAGHAKGEDERLEAAEREDERLEAMYEAARYLDAPYGYE